MKNELEQSEQAKQLAIQEGWLENVSGTLSHPDWRLSKEGIGFFVAHLLDENVFLNEVVRQQITRK